jgi:hypothetical protein
MHKQEFQRLITRHRFSLRIDNQSDGGKINGELSNV